MISNPCRLLRTALPFLVAPGLQAGPAADLRVSEVMYNSPGGGDFDFIEFVNRSGSETLDLEGVVIRTALDFTFPAGATLAPGQHLVVARTNAAAFVARYGSVGASVLGPFEGRLANRGERVQVDDATGTEIIDFTYNDGRTWPCGADGAGHSLVPRVFDDQRDGRLDLGPNWRRSTWFNGSPGAADPEPPAGIVLNEIAAATVFSNPSFPGYDSNDWIELYHAGSGVRSFADLYLSDDPDQLDKWPLTPGSLGPGERIVFDEITGFHNPLTSGFGLGDGGETVLLSHLPAAGPGRVVDCIDYPSQSTGTSFGRLPDGDPYFDNLSPSRGAANVLPAPEVIVTEFMYHPPDDLVGTSSVDNAIDEYIELFNPTPGALPLSTADGPYELKGSADYAFPPGVVLQPGAFLLVVPFDPLDPVAAAAFAAEYGLASLPALVGPWSNTLPNSSGRITLVKPGPPNAPGEPPTEIVVEEFAYFDRSPWDPAADGAGDALHRLATASPVSDPDNWTAAAPTPGAASPLSANQPPELSFIPDQNGTVGAPMQFDVDATDPDPGQALVYSLVDAPAGAQIDSMSGQFTWTPTAAQAGSFTVRVVVADNGTPPAGDEQAVTISILASNRPPVLSLPPRVYILPGEELSVQITATDPDPGQRLVFAQFGGPPGGSIGIDSGLYTWTPAAGDLGTTRRVTIAVADNGTPTGTDTAVLEIIVATAPPVITAMRPEVAPPGFTLEFSASPGVSYRLDANPGLDPLQWTQIGTVAPTGIVGTFRIDAAEPAFQATLYRVVALP